MRKLFFALVLLATSIFAAETPPNSAVVNVTWDVPASGVPSFYRLYYSTNAPTGTNVYANFTTNNMVQLAGTSVSTQLGGLAWGHQYYFVVTALNTNSTNKLLESQYSQQVLLSFAAIPLPPLNLRAIEP